jgi:hypothetical protein
MRQQKMCRQKYWLSCPYLTHQQVPDYISLGHSYHDTHSLDKYPKNTPKTMIGTKRQEATKIIESGYMTHS